jgi:hypothetical protein
MIKSGLSQRILRYPESTDETPGCSDLYITCAGIRPSSAVCFTDLMPLLTNKAGL